MPTHRFRRPFASGSKPTPDPYDSYLDKEGFYRKHVPRDAASLFRVISEQIYDSQEYHGKIRKDCVNFMIKHRNKYEEEIVDDFEKYTKKMVETQTPGTLLELKILSHMFERNILLFRPFELGVLFINEPEYRKTPLVRVFCTKDGHFDSVYTKSYITKAGFCQSIVYETLYKNVFKLPDIEYSVEVMLHSTDDYESNILFAETEYANDDEYATHIVFEDGRKFQLDRPEDTNCILKNPQLCHFHNTDFEKTAKELSNKPPSMFGGSHSFIKSSLSDKHTSCVRQLLNDGITPFSYKVAKALDPDMYRNVEFDSWSDARRNIRMKFGWHLQIGEKCLVNLEGENRPLFGYIQDIDEKNQSCIVYVDELCEKRSVLISCMRPLNVNAYEPKNYKGGKGDRKYNTFAFDKRAYNSLNRSSSHSDFVFDSCHCESNLCDVIYKPGNLHQFTNISNFQNPYNPYEIVAYPMQYTANAQNMPANPNTTAANAVKNKKNRHSIGQNHGHVDIVHPAEEVQQVKILKNEDKTGNSNNKIHHEQNPNDAPVNNNQNQQQLDQHQSSAHGQRESSIETIQQMPINQYSYAVRNGTHVYYPPCEFADQPPCEMVQNQPVFVVQPQNAYQAAPVQGYAAHPNHVAAINYVPMQYGQWPAQGYVQAPAQPIPYAVQPSIPIIRSDLLMSNGRPNYNANYSFSPMADDLSMHDQYTIRFYFNLGVEYWKQLQSIHGAGPLMAMIDGESFEQTPSDVDSQQTDVAAGFHQMTLDDNITTPTPPKGNGKHYNDSYMGRRGSSFRGSNYKRDNRDNRPNPGQRFQGTFPGPTKTFNHRNGPKYHGGHNDNLNNGRNNTYDCTPIKDGGHKPHQHQHTGGHSNAMNKRETYVPVNEIPNPGITFGSNVPPFPYHLGPPPANAIPRITPPVQERSAGVSPHEPIEFYNSGQHYNQYNLYPPHVQAPFVNHPPPIHHQMPTNFWMIQPPPNHAPQAQAQAQPLNTSNASNQSNMSSTGSNPSN